MLGAGAPPNQDYCIFKDRGAAAREQRILFKWLEFHCNLIDIQVTWCLPAKSQLNLELI